MEEREIIGVIMNRDKKQFDKYKIGYIITEYLGCDRDFIIENLKFISEVIQDVFDIIDKYKEDTRNIEYIFSADYEEGRASDDYSRINFIEDYNGICVYEIRSDE
jgi:hypothetical protein